MIKQNLVVENARLAFRNFSGKESKFNRAGNRNFCIIFDKETGEELQSQGWNLSILQPRDEYEEPSKKVLNLYDEYRRINFWFDSSFIPEKWYGIGK